MSIQAVSSKTVIKEIRSELVGDMYYKIQHASGLTVYLYPKPENASVFASFASKFGSVNTSFRIEGEEQIRRVPDGIAHYLEHKLFESKEGDAFLQFSKTGASANAYTSFDSTCYIFSSAENIPESLEILLSFVQDPYFTRENVQKEQGIIGQEIRMYEDDPQWRVMFNLLRAMYRVHPVKNDIAGTIESIAEITPESLYLCYNVFYNLSSMVLSLAGNIDLETVIDICDRMLKPGKKIFAERIFEKEPETVVSHKIEQKLPVAMPLFQFGFKRKPGDKPASQKELAAVDVLLELLTSDSSPLFRSLLDASLINETSFDSEYFEGPGYDAILISGESKDPEAVAEQILLEINRFRNEGISEEDFLRAKKSVYGRNIASLNSVESISASMTAMHFTDREIFACLDALKNVDIAAVYEVLSNGLDAEHSVLSIILPEDSDMLCTHQSITT